MITVGIDSGSQNTKAVVVKDGKVLARVKQLTEFDATAAAAAVYDKVLAEAGVGKDEVDAVASCGTGRTMVTFADGNVNEVSAAARGAYFVMPDAALVLDIGGESSRAIRLQAGGAIRNYEINDKCASGAGTFIESMARTLEITTEEMGPKSLAHTKELPMNAQCVVFAESEVISLIHRQEKVEDIAYGIHVGIANRISSLVRRVGVVDGIVLIGGPAHNKGLVQCLELELGKPVRVPEAPEFVSAIGAATYAVELAAAKAG